MYSGFRNPAKRACRAADDQTSGRPLSWLICRIFFDILFFFPYLSFDRGLVIAGGAVGFDWTGGESQDKKTFFQGLGCDSEIVKICVRDSKKPRDFKMDSKTEVKNPSFAFCM